MAYKHPEGMINFVPRPFSLPVTIENNYLQPPFPCEPYVMCGLSACFDLYKGSLGGRNTHHPGCEKRRTRILAQLNNSAEAQRHRGPDAKGVWVSVDNSAGLGHVRLSTRDLSSAGNQPLHGTGDADHLHVVVNGELYYDDAVRDEVAKGYRFQSGSDSEMVIALYKRFGLDFITHLRGEFALVIYDAKDRTIVAARDRFGVKPLHYGIFDDRLLIATQAKGVVELLEDRRSLQWDAQCLAQAGGHYSDRSMFEGIRRFPQGHLLVVRQGHPETMSFKPYYRTVFSPNHGLEDRTADQMIQQLRAQLLEAIRLRLTLSDVPVGILLSGGVDSSAVAGMAAHLCRELDLPLPTCFTIAFPDDPELDESSLAERTAQHLGLPIEKVVVSEQALADEFNEACWLGEALMWDLQHVAKKILSKYISKRGIKVVLNGDGSDELFGGYGFFVLDRLREDDLRSAASSSRVDSAKRESLLKRETDKFKWFGAEKNQDKQQHSAARKLGLPQSFCNLAVVRHDDWLTKEIRDLNDPFDGICETFSQQDIEDMQTYHPLHRGLLAWRKTLLPNMIIAAISDGAEMAHGVESRPPFLDHVVADLVNTFPVDMLVHLEDDGPVEKWIFREATKSYVMPEVYKRRKQAFAAPFRWQKGGPLYEKLSSIITREHVQNLGFADWDFCENLLDRAFDEKDQHVFRNAIWLAQVISIGRQFNVPRLRLDSVQRPNSTLKTGTDAAKDRFEVQANGSRDVHDQRRLVARRDSINV